MREEMKKSREEMKKAMDMLRKMQGGALPGGLPGGFPGGFPGVFPGGLPGGFPNVPGIGLNPGRMQEGRLGARVEKPSETLVEQLDLPRGQGLILEQVKADSPASKAGLKDHDILLEVNGKAVPSNAEDFVKQLGEIKANTPVDVVVLRKGKKETLKGLSLPEAKQAAPGGLQGGFGFPNVFPGGKVGQGVFGVGPDGKLIMQETTRDGNNFTTKRQEGDLTITVTGTVDDGKPVPSSIEITEGQNTTKYESIDKVPEAHRETVKKMLDVGAGKKIKIKAGGSL
jgi:membrane-associated protease RseP (regulator of RpoE activity)